MDIPKDSKIRAIRRDVVIDNTNPPPIPELVKETKWLYDAAIAGNLRELVYSASDIGIEPIYKIVGESVNYTMMYCTLETVKDKYFEDVVKPSIRQDELGEVDE